MKIIAHDVKIGILKSLNNPHSKGRAYTLSYPALDVMVKDGLINRIRRRHGWMYEITELGHEFLSNHNKNFVV